MKKVVLFVLLSVGMCGALPAQERATTVSALNAEAVKAYRGKDYARFVSYEKQAQAIEPSNARVSYNIACGLALQSNAQGAVGILNALLARKLDLGAEADDDFTSIRGTPEWKGYLVNLAELRKPLVRSEVAFRLPDPGLISAGIAFDPATGDTYIGSARERKIIKRTKAGVLSDFIQPGQDGFWAAGSLLIDSKRKLLYASTSVAPFITGFVKEEDGKSGLFAFDLKSGKLVRKVVLPGDAKKHYLNALALDHAGNVYVSDSLASGIYRLALNASQLEVLAAPTVFPSTQGLAFSDDEKTLFVADFVNGLWAFNMASKTPRRVEAPPDAWLAGLDGLSRVKDGFVVVQIGPQPSRVIRLRMDAAWQRIAAVDVLEMSHPDYAGPIQGTLGDGGFLYVANSFFDLANPQTGAFAIEKAKPTVILRLPL